MSMNELLDEQQAQQNKIVNLFKNYLAYVKNEPKKGFATSYLSRLEKEWQTCEVIHSTILSTENVDKTHAYFTSGLFESCENNFYNVKGQFLNHLEEFAAKERVEDREATRLALVAQHERTIDTLNTSIQPHPRSSIQLAKLGLPTFDGNYENWENFRDIFRSLVHESTELPAIVKFLQLRSHIQGDALTLIKDITMSEANYPKAWQKLIDRYENKRRIVSFHLSSFFTTKPMVNESSIELKRIMTSAFSPLESLSAINREVKHWDDVIVYFVSSLFEIKLRKEWEKSLGDTTDPPTVEVLKKFCDSQLMTLESIERSSQNGNFILNNRSNIKTNSTKTSTHSQSVENNKMARICPCCDQDHGLWSCTKFKNKSPQDRIDFVEKIKVCKKCLNKHDGKPCTYKFSCRKCSKPHNTLVHVNNLNKVETESRKNLAPAVENNNAEVQETLNETTPTSCTSTLSTSNLSIGRGVLLSTALVYVSGGNGLKLLVRALIDQCSQVSLISENLSQKLKLSRQKIHLPISGVGEGETVVSSRAVTNFTVTPRFESSFACQVQAAILPKISSYKPPKSQIKFDIGYLKGLIMADPHFDSDAPIDLLLGADIHSLIVDGGIKRGQSNEPLATSTHLGWLLSGNLPVYSNNLSIPSSFHCMIAEENELNESLQKFWRVEEAPKRKFLTSDEEKCEEHFLNTHKRDVSGRYIVDLPFKTNEFQLGDSYTPSLRMLQCMESKFEKDLKFKSAYHDFLDEYLKTDHMSLAESDSFNQNETFFLPHHGVLKESSSTTKLRTVFNGSVKTNYGTSLNDVLYTGENLLPSLIDLTSHWRKYEFVFAADAEKMFRQVIVNEKDRPFQSILWRFDTNQPVQIYRLNTVTYGLKPSPFLASRVVKQLATDHQSDFPLGATVLSSEIYMDDVISGAHSKDEAILKIHETINLCKVGGFSLRKWMSNHPDLLQTVDPKLYAVDPLELDDKELSVNILGISWHPLEDTFHFQVTTPRDTNKITKRYILSNIAKLFDPMGWLGLVIIKAKILMQTLWLLKVDWDTTLTDDIVENWLDWKNQLHHLNQISIPRWNHFHLNSELVEIHGFADASKFAYGSVVYLRVVNNGKVSISMQLAKSRVAPINVVSVAKLELMAAELLTCLVEHFVHILKINIDAIHLWTDSMDVLYWLNDHPSRWQTFVANRTSKILTLLPNAHWHYVKSRENPADIISRGINASEYANCDLWWNGPSWLSDNTDSWPSTQPELIIPDREKTLKSFLLVVNNTTIKQSIWELLDRYSCFRKIRRITSYCVRFIVKLMIKFNLKRQENHGRKELKFHLLSLEFFDYSPFTLEYSTKISPSVAETEAVELLWVYWTQNQFYHNEVKSLVLGKNLNSKSEILNLNPILLKNLLRVGGRISQSLLAPDTRHPLILPSKARLTEFLINEAHDLTLHGGTQLTLATIRNKYWIIKGRLAIRCQINNCFTCKRQRGKLNSQLMGDLPLARVTPAYPFERSGVDYAGPYNVRLSKTRGKGTMKGYICIFICMCTRAVHIEAVEDYSTPAFLAAFSRFVARRGHCSELFSDNGTNFVGADNQLKEMFSETSSQLRQIVISLADDGTSWTFNPPGAPHCGGLWEAAVKSCKFHLKRLIGDQVLTFVEFSTLLARIEACLNSRPLIPLPDDPFDPPFLTPSHFLIQRQSFLFPEPDVRQIKVPVGKRWLYITQLAQEFWSRWSTEYLTSLQPRAKWRSKTDSLQVGDLVFLKIDNSTPTKWPVGRIIKAEPSRDGQVRVVTIKTPTTILERHVTKTVFLFRPSVETTDESGRNV